MGGGGDLLEVVELLPDRPSYTFNSSDEMRNTCSLALLLSCSLALLLSCSLALLLSCSLALLLSCSLALLLSCSLALLLSCSLALLLSCSLALLLSCSLALLLSCSLALLLSCSLALLLSCSLALLLSCSLALLLSCSLALLLSCSLALLLSCSLALYQKVQKRLLSQRATTVPQALAWTCEESNLGPLTILSRLALESNLGSELMLRCIEAFSLGHIAHTCSSGRLPARCKRCSTTASRQRAKCSTRTRGPGRRPGGPAARRPGVAPAVRPAVQVDRREQGRPRA